MSCLEASRSRGCDDSCAKVGGDGVGVGVGRNRAGVVGRSMVGGNRLVHYSE